jgi:hypothetical protein
MTGYTQELVDRKLGFEDFALLCSRAFGALVTLRDEPLSAPIPQELKPSNYHFKEIGKAKAALLKLRAIKTKKDRIVWGRKRLKKDIAAYTVHRDEAKSKDTTGQMRAVLMKVEAWKPPHPDHAEFKKFMVQQLTDSIAMEERSGDFYGDMVTKLEGTGPLTAYEQALKKAKDDLAYHTKEWKEEVARTKSRNLWLGRLRRSLKK